MSDLDEKDRCCGRKPIVYKKQNILFCHRCDKEFDKETKKQIPNWAWKQNPDGTFVKKCEWTPTKGLS